MNLAQIIREVGEGGGKGVVPDSKVKDYVNRAQRMLAERQNFTFMRSLQTATLTSGNVSVALSSRFKELDAEASPVVYADPDGSGRGIPVSVTSRAEAQRVDWRSASPLCPVWIEQTDGGLWSLFVPPQAAPTSDLVYTLACFLFPSDLVLGTDTNGMTTGGVITQALIQQAKALAFAAEDPTDARGLACQDSAEKMLMTFRANDERRKLSGRALHW